MVAVQQHLRRCPLRRLLEIVFAWESLPLLMLLSRCGPCMQTLPLAQSRAVLRRSWHLPVGSRSLELHGGVPKRGLPFCEHQTTTAAGRSLRCTALALHYQASTIACHGVDEERPFALSIEMANQYASLCQTAATDTARGRRELKAHAENVGAVDVRCCVASW